MKPGTLVIRADANEAMGTGHVMRCLALAQAWRREDGAVVFAMAESTAAITARLEREDFSITTMGCRAGGFEDANALASLAAELDAAWIAVDGYHFSPTYPRVLKEAGFRLLWIDDTGRCSPYSTDVILNQNLYAVSGMYRNIAKDTTLLLGPEYVLLRKEFLAWQSWRRDFAARAKKLLVAMGGSDSQNVTAQVLRALAQSEFEIEVTVVVGGSNPHERAIQQLALELPGQTSIRTDVSDVTELMAGADLAISAAGVTCYELALLQVPMILLTLAENQVPTAAAFAECGAAVNLGNPECGVERIAETVHRLALDDQFRRSLGKKARSLVDGKGASRVCHALLRIAQNESTSVELLRT